MRPFGESKKDTVEWIKSGAMQAARYDQLQQAYQTCFDRLNVRLNKTQLRWELSEFAKNMNPECIDNPLKARVYNRVLSNEEIHKRFMGEEITE